MSDFPEIDKMTLYEYDMRMTAYHLQQVDREYEIHLQAWVNWNVQAMKSKGKNKRVPVFKDFKQFFNYEQRVKDVLGVPVNVEKKHGIAKIIKEQAERRQKSGEL